MLSRLELQYTMQHRYIKFAKTLFATPFDRKCNNQAKTFFIYEYILALGIVLVVLGAMEGGEFLRLVLCEHLILNVY
jgi:hypothetical protein